ncbi:MAG: hypothetical protein Q4F43_07745 [Eubacteriales bacterium]|nr:hypothetical protein [Eubacteriales bacterium]
MDKYELKVSLDEIDSLIAERRFAEAAELADTIDWTRVRGVHVLCRISDLYKINKRYKDSRDLMEIAYERNPTGRKIIYSLCELELKLNNYIHALQLYNAFINVAPRDSDRYLLQYKLYKKQDVNVYEQIAVLEEFLQHDFRERWAYELATLYLRAGEEQRCIRQCDEIVAYFGDGRFVIRALELKKSLTALTPQQEERLEILRKGGKVPPAPAPAEETPAAAPSEQVQEDSQVKTRQKAAVKEPAAAQADREVLLSDTIPVEAGKVMPAAKQIPEVPDPASYETPGDDTDSAEPEGTPEEYTDALLRDVHMQETIARGMQEIGDYDNVLAQETSGQLAMVMEEEPQEETQVEGQLNLEQIMSEWEKIRRDSEQQRLAEARRRVLERSEEAKRELYGDGQDAPQPGGSTRSWKKEDVEEGLRS